MSSAKENNIPTQDFFSQFNQKNEGDIDFREIWYSIKRKRKLALFTASIIVSLTTCFSVYKRITSPVYKGSFSLLINDPISSSGANEGGENVNVYTSLALNKTEIDTPTLIKFLKSPIVLDEISKKYKISSGFLSANLNIVEGKIGRQRAKGILDISFFSKDKKNGQKLINDLSKTYLNVAQEQKQIKLLDGLEFLNSQRPILEEKAKNIQNKLEKFRQDNLLIDPKMEVSVLKGQQTRIEDQIIVLTNERQRLKDLKKNINSGSLSIQNYQEVIGANDVGLFDSNDSNMTLSTIDNELKNQLLSLEKQLSESRGKYKEDSQIVTSLKDKIALLKPQLINDQLKSYDVALSINLEKLEAAKSQLQIINKKFDKQPELIKEYSTLEIQSKIAQESIGSLSVAIENFQLEAAQRTTPWKLISYPRMGSSPVEPSVFNNIILGLFVGILFGALLALIRDRNDYVYHKVNEVKNDLKLPHLAHIPYVKAFENIKENKSELLSRVLDDNQVDSSKDDKYQRFFYQEAFRNFYTSIRFLNGDKLIKSVSITSSIPSEGKSLINIILSKTLSDIGERVLLIDADLRKPQIHKRLGINNFKGLSNLLTDPSLKFNDVIQTVDGFKSWSVITSGIKPPDPTRLFSSKRMKEINSAIVDSNQFDIIIYDVPPILGLADSALLSENTDGMILVVGLDKVDRTLPRESVNRINESGCTLLGVVTNALKYDKNNSGYGDGYASAYASYVDLDEEGSTELNIEEDLLSIKFIKNNKILMRLITVISPIKNKLDELLKWLDN